MKIFSGNPRALVVAACMALMISGPSAALAHSDHGPCQDCMSAEEFRLADVRHFFPSALGQSWNYVGYGQEFAGFKRTVTQSKDGRVQVEDVNGGAHTARVFSMAEDMIAQQVVLSESEAKGDLLAAKPNQETLLLKGPLQQGATWEDGMWRYRLLSVTKTVWVPAGLFAGVVEVQARSLARPNEVVVACYAPEVGLVRRDYYSGDGAQISAQLQSMSIAGQNALPQEKLSLPDFFSGIVKQQVPGEATAGVRFARIRTLNDKGHEHYAAIVDVYRAPAGFNGDPLAMPESWKAAGWQVLIEATYQAQFQRKIEGGQASYVLTEWLPAKEAYPK
ncbi:hypothetical protein [Anaeromusa acidaminophila]|uniref:hypothetical protein n=1 Tax=Anaeromusa acidaminophila TaxID=81464 RepID=UPI00036A0DB2|nr:hypothetical protein [Anaeromusa acidaminophila]